jgi:hypothetical protein
MGEIIEKIEDESLFDSNIFLYHLTGNYPLASV